MKFLVIDVGGTHIKIRATGQKKQMENPSGLKMTANKMVAAVRKIIYGWKYDVVKQLKAALGVEFYTQRMESLNVTVFCKSSNN